MVSLSIDKFIFILLASVLIFFSILLKNSSDAAKATEHAYVDHVTCRNSPIFTANCTCKLNFITRMKKSFTSKCLLTKQLNNIFGHTQLYHRFRSGYQVFLVDRIISVCDYLQNKTTSKIIDMVFSTFKKYASYNESWTCPFQGLFDIDQIPLNGDPVNNMFIPVGDYFINLTVFANEKDFVWNAKFYFTIPEGKTIEDDRMGRR